MATHDSADEKMPQELAQVLADAQADDEATKPTTAELFASVDPGSPSYADGFVRWLAEVVARESLLYAVNRHSNPPKLRRFHSTEDLYASYRLWCEKNADPFPLARVPFGKRMSEIGRRTRQEDARGYDLGEAPAERLRALLQTRLSSLGPKHSPLDAADALKELDDVVTEAQLALNAGRRLIDHLERAALGGRRHYNEIKRRYRLADQEGGE